jgi:GntR family transcriptional regulator
MIIQIDTHSGVPIYRQIIDQIRGEIFASSIGVGEQLPAVRQLAAQLKVNPMTVSKAYSILELQGLLERRRGIGLFVAQIDEKEKIENSRQLIDRELGDLVRQARSFGLGQRELVKIIKHHFKENMDS